MTTSTTSSGDPLIGRTVCGCKIVRLIGRGGMGNVYVGRQLSLDRIVAVKVLSPALSSNEEFLGRFRREARALANLKHPNIVAVHDFGQDDDIHAVVMEHVDGESVADVLTRSSVVPLPQAIDIVRQVCEGLACAHRQGVIHCDLKPENILLTAEGIAKVIDFGLAKSLRGDALRITQDGSILGTPNYMSPEQCEGTQLDARTDIYSLGATFYRMVAGVDAFDADNPLAVMLKHKTEPAPDPRRFNADLTPAVARVVLRMMAKKPDDRYQEAGEVVAALADEALTEPEPDRVPSPRRDLALLRDALDGQLITAQQARESLADRDDEPLADLLVRTGLLSREQADELHQREGAREAALRDQQFARFTLDAGLATSAQVTACVRIQQARRKRGQPAKLSNIMVEQGILDQQQVVRVLLRQLKDAQRREDASFVALVRSRGLLSEAELSRCIAEQRREEARGHHKVLRQLVVGLDLLSAAEVRELLEDKLRGDIAALVAERESPLGRPGSVFFDEAALKVEDTEPCPACGHPVELGARTCPACGQRMAAALRRSALVGGQETPADDGAAGGESPGKWAIRRPDGQPSKPLTAKALLRLVRERRLKPDTVLRGPLTNGVWRQARHVPRLCRVFGVCHYCEAKLPPKAPRCPKCGADPDQPMQE